MGARANPPSNVGRAREKGGVSRLFYWHHESGEYNYPMRLLVVLAVAAMVGAAPAAALETARNLAASGAPHLALARVEQLQPRESSAPGWAEWEALRLTLLVELKRYGEALK